MAERNGVTLYRDVPVDHHPSALTGDSPVIASAQVGLQSIYDVVGSISETERQLGQNPDAAVELARISFPMLEKSIASSGRSLDLVLQAKHNAEAAVNSTLTSPDRNLSQEIRAHLYQNKAEAFSICLQAIEDGDLSIVQAALHGPAPLSGLSQTQQRELRQMAADKFAAEPAQIVADATRAEAKLRKAQDFLTDWARSARGRWMPSTSTVAALNELMAKKGEPK